MQALASSCKLALLALPVFGCGRIGYDLLGSERSERPDLDSGLTDVSSGGQGGGGGNEADAGTGGSPGGGGGAGTGGAIPDGGSDASMDAPDENDAARDSGSDGAGSPADCTPQVVTDYCGELPALPNEPQVNGVLDCGLELHRVVPQGWTNSVDPFPPVNVAVDYAVAWRPDGLYWFVRVQDPDRVPAEPGIELWKGDGIELYVDDDAVFTAVAPNYDAIGTRQLVIAAPANEFTPLARGEVYANIVPGFPVDWTSTRFRAEPEPGGYVVEAFVSAADLGLAAWTLAAGQSVGMNLSHNVSVATPLADAGSNGQRLGQYFVSVITTPGESRPEPFHNPLAFCTPVLRNATAAVP